LKFSHQFVFTLDYCFLSRMIYESTRDWAMNEFGGAGFADVRWQRRLVAVGTQAARRPAGKVSEVFGNAADRQGAYALLECDDVARAQIAAAMFAADARRCVGLAFVYVPVDGSSITLTDQEQEKGFGSIGARKFGARGLKVISALLVSPQGVTLGLGSQIWWTRTGEAKKQRHGRRRTEDKETQHWLEAMQQTRQTFDDNAPQTCCWFQLDREGDAWPIITEADKEGHWFTIRGNHNRRVVSEGGSKTYLRSLVGLQPVACTYVLPVSAGPARSGRGANMVVRAGTATLDFRDKRTKKHFSKTVNVVLAREEGTTPAGEKPIEWLLLTNRPVESTEDLAQIIYGYSLRWRIEDFHRTWKSGACNVEEMQLRSVEAAEKWATILAGAAVRIERLKHLARKEPELPATNEFSPIELRAIILLRFGNKGRRQIANGTVPTIKQAVQWVAEIGGYTGKSSGGPPGSTTIARGLREVLAAARVITAMESNCD